MSAPKGPPLYKGEALDGERGPGLGCFWIQSILLVVFLILTPLTVIWAWDPFVSGVLLLLTLILLFFAGQTTIFLLRLVAMDRRSRRAPLDPKAKQTVGQIEDGTATTPPPGVTDAAPRSEDLAPRSEDLARPESKRDD